MAAPQLPPGAADTAPRPGARARWMDAIPRLLDNIGGQFDARVGSWVSVLVISALGGLFFLLIQISQIRTPDYNLSEGSVALQHLRVSRDVQIEDPAATERERVRARASVLPVYDLDPDVAFQTLDRLTEMFEFLALQDPLVPDVELVSALEQRWGLTYDKTYVQTLRSLADDSTLRLKFKLVINRLYQNWIVPERERLILEHAGGISIRFQPSDTAGAKATKIVVEPKDYDKILGPAEARKYLQTISRELLAETDTWTRLQLVRLISDVLRPNLMFNPTEFENESAAAAEAVRPVVVQFSKGEVVVREGARVTVEDIRRIKLLKTGLEETSTWRVVFGTFLFGMLVYLLMATFGRQSAWRTPHTTRDRLFVVLSTTLMLGLLVLSMPVVDGIHRGFPALENEILLLAFPTTAIAMICRIVYRPRYAILLSIIPSVLAGYIIGNPWMIYVYAAGGAVAAMRLAHVRRRSTFFVIGIQVGIVQAIMAAAIFFIRETRSLDTFGYISLSAFAGGINSAWVAMILLPIFEWLFNFTTDVKLAELSEDDQPLLRWLHIQAPGTYNHSVNVGRLAEVAAEAIGADALLVKVGAYYHDVGKAYMPQYFVENQKDYNPHEELRPSMSALTIISHVNKGRDVAVEHRLPQSMIDFIMEHHGTGLVEYFYVKAVDQANEEGTEPPDEARFHYPGPKPQTKESGILMLADAVEATSRVLNKPTEANIRGMIHRLINKIFADGQLDECPLTLKDLHSIARSFSTVLVGMLHARIAYPSNITQEPRSGEASAHRDSDSGSFERPALEPDAAQGVREGLKRIGIS